MRPSPQNPVPAVLSEAAAPHKIREHEGQRGGVRHAGGACAGDGLTLSEWVRDVLLAARMSQARSPDEVVLAEVLALRTLFLTISSSARAGEADDARRRCAADRAGGRGEDAAGDGAPGGGAGDRSEPETKAETAQKPIQRRADDGGVGTEAILESMAEPDARVDVGGVLPVAACSSPGC